MTRRQRTLVLVRLRLGGGASFEVEAVSLICRLWCQRNDRFGRSYRIFGVMLGIALASRADTSCSCCTCRSWAWLDELLVLGRDLGGLLLGLLGLMLLLLLVLPTGLPSR